MNICFPFADFERGGAEKYTLHLAEEAIKEGYGACFVLGDKNKNDRKLIPNIYPIKIVEIQSSFNPIKVFSAIFKLKKYFKEEKIDIVHTQMLREHSLAIGAKVFGAKIKIIRTFHRLDQFNWKMKPLLWIYNWKTDAFVAVSKYVSDQMIKNGINSSKIQVIYNGVPEVSVIEHKKALGYIGRLTPEKGIYEFVKRYNSKTPLLIGGDGPDLSKIKEIANENLSIKILGPITDHASFFSNISILVLPSNTEVMPLSMLEAFSAGVPVVAFNLPSLKEFVSEKTGVSITTDDYNKLSDTAQIILEDDVRLSEMSKVVKKLYNENYTVNHMWQKTKSLYQKVLS